MSSNVANKLKTENIASQKLISDQLKRWKDELRRNDKTRRINTEMKIGFLPKLHDLIISFITTSQVWTILVIDYIIEYQTSVFQHARELITKNLCYKQWRMEILNLQHWITSSIESY